MNQSNELREGQAYTARVQQLLLALIEQARVISTDHLQSIQAIVADAWEDLRVKPTALSEEDLEQLSAEVSSSRSQPTDASGKFSPSNSLDLNTFPYLAISFLMPPRTVPNGFSEQKSRIPASII